MTEPRSQPLVAAGLAAALLLVATAPVAAQVWRGKGRISGSVSDEAGKPIEGATVTLRLREVPDAGPEPLTTNRHGKWSALGLVQADWTVHIEAKGFDPSDGSLRVNEYGNNPPIDVRLQSASASADPRVTAAIAEVERANALLGERRAAEARAIYEAALPLFQGANRALILKKIAFCQMVEGDDASAVETLKSALVETPDDGELLRLLVDRLVILRREAEAQEFIARLGPGANLDPNTQLQMGINLYNDDKLAEALAHFDGLIQGNPSWPDAYYYRGRTLLGMSEFARAKQDFEKVLELDPAHAFAEDCRSFIKSL